MPKTRIIVKPRSMTFKSDTLPFVRAFLKSPGKIGSIVPSATSLAQAMVGDLQLDKGESIVELGPGTGSFTRVIQTLLSDENHYLGIEREPNFVRLLSSRFPDLQFVQGSAEVASQLHAEVGLGPVRVVVSGLPFSTLNIDITDKIISDVYSIMEYGSIFRTFQYVHAYPLPAARKFRKKMYQRFGMPTRRSFVIRHSSFVIRHSSFVIRHSSSASRPPGALAMQHFWMLVSSH